MKEAYFAKQQNIDNMRHCLTQAAEVLTRNHVKVQGALPGASPRFTIIQSFYVPGGTSENESIRTQSLNEIESVISANSGGVVSYRPSTMDVYRSVLTALHFNNYIWNATTSTYVSKREDAGGLYMRHPKKDIEPVATWDYASVCMSDCTLYLSFGDGKFRLDPKKFERYIESQTYYVTNRRQREFVEKAELVAKTLREMSAIAGRDCSGHWRTSPNYDMINAMVIDIK